MLQLQPISASSSLTNSVNQTNISDMSDTTNISQFFYNQFCKSCKTVTLSLTEWLRLERLLLNQFKYKEGVIEKDCSRRGHVPKGFYLIFIYSLNDNN